MKKRLSILVVAVASLMCNQAEAVRIEGKVTYVGTVAEYTAANEGYSTRFRALISGSICENQTNKVDRWVLVTSGRMDGQYAHNAVNMRNAYSTVLAAMMTGKTIQIDGAPNCTASKVQEINLWNSGIGLY